MAWFYPTKRNDNNVCPKQQLLSEDKNKKLVLLHIMCGYRCDKAVNKNDTREVI